MDSWDGWTIAVFGTNDVIIPDPASLVDLSVLGTTDPMTDDNWLKLNVRGASPNQEQANEMQERTGGIVAHPRAQVQKYNIAVQAYTFPDDMKKLMDLTKVLRKRRIFMYKGTYDFPANDFSIHPDGKALAVAITKSQEDDYDNGLKEITLSVRTIFPVPYE